ncbi:MAG: VWA domain-containing protein [Anaerolineae bacterium]|nr:VWA domain-containing protein [Anaerolineae bacterium]
MGFLAPLALAFAALGIPILIVYMLKLRREARHVSSTMLWSQVLQDRQANAPWQKLRRNLLMLIQLLLLFLLVLALARPYSEISRLFQGNVIILLDASASMQATDTARGGGAATRFDLARDRAKQIVDGLGANDTLTLIAVADTPRVLASLCNDKSVLRQALSTTQVTNTQADWEAAFILAQSSAQQAARTTTVVLSDGGLPDGLPPLPGQVRYIPTGITAENVAITALAIRDGPHGPQAFVRVANAGTQPVTTLVQIDVNESLFDARTLDIAAGGESGIALDDLPLDTQRIQARLPDDTLAIDNQAWAVRAADREATVFLVTPGNSFLERAIGLMPNLNPVTVRVTDTLTHTVTLPGGITPDLIIFDTLTPADLPELGNLLFIGPPVANELIRVGGMLTDTTILDVEGNHPLLHYVDAAQLRELNIARAREVSVPSWAETLIEARSGPLLLAGEVGGRRIAILTFDLHQSDLPLKITFPILIANLTYWLAPTSAVDVPAQLSPGMPALIRPQIGVSEIVVTAPSGQQWTFEAAGSEPIPFAQTDEPGIYTVEQKRVQQGADQQISQASFAVNLFSELESYIEPRDEIDVGQTPISAQTESSVGRREWWRWPALAALSMLIIEWFVHLRGRLPFSIRETFARLIPSREKNP